MATDPSKAVREGQSAAEMIGSKIERDPSFVRINAEETIVASKDRDVEISLLVRDRNPVFQGESVIAENGLREQHIRVIESLSEIARIRLQGPEAFNMAMQIVERTIASGRIKTALFRTAVNTMLDEYDAGGTEDGDEGGRDDAA